jgi:hypothetical protein
MDKLQINIPVQEDGKLFWITGAWGEDGTVLTCVNTACPDDCEHIWDVLCRRCPTANKEIEEKLVERYQDKMYDAMKALKEIFFQCLKLQNYLIIVNLLESIILSSVIILYK